MQLCNEFLLSLKKLYQKASPQCSELATGSVKDWIGLQINNYGMNVSMRDLFCHFQ